MIFTLVVAFDLKEEIDYLNSLKNRFEAKPTKKDLEWSRKDLLDTMEKYKLNTDDGEILFKNHIKIDNTNLSPDEVTEIIIEKMKLKRIKPQEEVEK